MQQFSLLDLSPIPEGKTAADALTNTVSLARAAEGFGYYRYWLAEHHNMPGIAVTGSCTASASRCFPGRSSEEIRRICQCLSNLEASLMALTRASLGDLVLNE
jgi:alkanesulfonate monooxygenase SsuD/methylene tetrahydromethanopterin reductase-like flavin-dependent oxidoreductase (luciferase family)